MFCRHLLTVISIEQQTDGLENTECEIAHDCFFQGRPAKDDHQQNITIIFLHRNNRQNHVHVHYCRIRLNM